MTAAAKVVAVAAAVEVLVVVGLTRTPLLRPLPRVN